MGRLPSVRSLTGFTIDSKHRLRGNFQDWEHYPRYTGKASCCMPTQLNVTALSCTMLVTLWKPQDVFHAGTFADRHVWQIKYRIPGWSVVPVASHVAYSYSVEAVSDHYSFMQAPDFSPSLIR